MADKESGENRNQQGQFLPGNCANPGGRPKGSRNATTMTLQQALLESFHQLGGVQWLVQLGRTEPRTFATLLLRLLPQAQPEESDDEVLVDDPDPDV
ncbi:DUF5681 domain-containing protein [Acidithiobacillus sulfuriphilus]|uniref:DUF5681 domain-containing protein n=2 Tax=Acidithiobacillus sulfuriphilus TaxID=1867749 RepID=A0A3M8QZC9_9PROT|nr:DUF5681 domain-containing protein [Acidithiobacillus sulfuriphilus]RNF61649.1 hypothetical protein EC580_08165 [Acidithiobacillus sulfuriphilus]